MHIVNVTVGGLALLFVFVLVSRLINRAGGGSWGATAFIWVWFGIALANGATGVLRAGISPLIEIVAFLPVFGIPAATAWLASRKLRTA